MDGALLQEPSANEAEIDYRRLRALLEASDTECGAFGRRLDATEALQTTLFRMRRGLIGSPAGFVDALRPFGRVAELLDPRHDAVMLSIRAHSKQADFVQLRAGDFLRAQDLVRRLGRRT
jgi:hypothetical protein